MKTETFVLNDQRSIRHLSKNSAGVETDAPSYLAFMRRVLEINDGWLSQKELEEAVVRNYGPSWGKSDLRPIRIRNRSVHGEYPKWKNTLAWAKVLGRTQGLLATRGKYVVSLEFADDDLQAWALAKKRKRNSFKKHCPKCGRQNRLANAFCERCEAPFPKPNSRVRKIPR